MICDFPSRNLPIFPDTRVPLPSADPNILNQKTLTATAQEPQYEIRAGQAYLTPAGAAHWLVKFLPALARPDFDLQPGQVQDRSDGKLVHLDGLNLYALTTSLFANDSSPTPSHP